MKKTFELVIQVGVEGDNSEVVFTIDDVAQMFTDMMREHHAKPSLAWNMHLTDFGVIKASRNYRN